MATFSRWMRPASPSPFPLWAWAISALYVGALVILALWKPWVWLLLGAFVALQVLFRRTDARRWQQRAAARTGEDIGTFARSFDRKGAEAFDPRVIRATWEALALELQPGGPRVPVRPNDDLEDDFEIEYVDVLATAVAERAGRSARAWERTPSILDGVLTVADLVRVVSRQPTV